MRVSGVLHIFWFETKQGEEICVTLQTHINDVMLRRRCSKARSAASGSINGDLFNNFRPPSVYVCENVSRICPKLLKNHKKMLINAGASESCFHYGSNCNSGRNMFSFSRITSPHE